jgi:hypothetical protein
MFVNLDIAEERLMDFDDDDDDDDDDEGDGGGGGGGDGGVRGGGSNGVFLPARKKRMSLFDYDQLETAKLERKKRQCKWQCAP